MPGAILSASAIDVTPERLMSSWVITNTAAAAFVIGWVLLETEVTLISINDSKGMFVRSVSGSADTGEGGVSNTARIYNRRYFRIEFIAAPNPVRFFYNNLIAKIR